MTILTVLLTTLHVLISIVLVIAILMQSSKGGGLASSFGGQATSSVFSPRGAANALATLTQYLAGAFLALSLILSLMAGAGMQSESITQKVINDSPASQLTEVGDLNLGAGSSAGEASAPVTEEPTETK
jgi:preprotein translocase subunit SecG